ncbi:hypothetical protein SAMN05660703_1702 [Cellulophaga tyrosinoxydans]|uniref:DUF4372 domain-containing protein n=1 Tax=Cellulophaga tyrosinoxydans TaxID=504486 RepID=A0A1W2A0D3_9FLAO|nr:hypothetical protein SAMN05660703_1702 [Cellulophaga tyrosinoxydans]
MLGKDTNSAHGFNKIIQLHDHILMLIFDQLNHCSLNKRIDSRLNLIA